MKALNGATQILLRRFKEKFDKDAAEGKPTVYSAIIAKKKELHPELSDEEWPDNAREQAVEALGMWAAMHVGGMLAAVMTEINDLGQKAAATDDEAVKQAAIEVTGSMGFIETVFSTWFENIDIEAIAEGLFEAAVASTGKKGKKKKSASSLIDELMAKYRPSKN